MVHNSCFYPLIANEWRTIGRQDCAHDKMIPAYPPQSQGESDSNCGKYFVVCGAIKTNSRYLLVRYLTWLLVFVVITTLHYITTLHLQIPDGLSQSWRDVGGGYVQIARRQSVDEVIVAGLADGAGAVSRYQLQYPVLGVVRQRHAAARVSRLKHTCNAVAKIVAETVPNRRPAQKQIWAAVIFDIIVICVLHCGSIEVLDAFGSLDIGEISELGLYAGRDIKKSTQS